jgi:hypothetical protein
MASYDVAGKTCQVSPVALDALGRRSGRDWAALKLDERCTIVGGDGARGGDGGGGGLTSIRSNTSCSTGS